MTDTTPDRKQTRPFAAWLQDVRQGGLNRELGEKLADLAIAVQETGKAGSLQLTVKLSMNADEMSMTAVDSVKLTKPEHTRPTSMFFPDAEGNLTRTNPAQEELPLREVQTSDGELAQVDTTTGEVKDLAAAHG